MLFNSYQFLIFFPLVVLLYYIIPCKLKMYWLLMSSYIFYMGWNAKYAVLIFACTAATWFGGNIISKTTDKKARKVILTCSIMFPLSILLVFKYFRFLWESVSGVIRLAGVEPYQCPWSLILPVGISFYTFQALGYVIDVYKGKVEAEKNFFRYALFISFFPQLVAGPIERSGNLLAQIKEITREKRICPEEIRDGLIYMLYGYFLKMVLADNLAVYVDTVFEQYYFYGSIELIIAAVFFSFQIYCDFASYSIIAIGAAKVMGFQLMENFHAPYFAASVKEFWRRWHISLSTWLKDYLYIPLGGNRVSKTRYYCNLIITFLVSGLWHGANWTYVVWGGLHGMYQVMGEIFEPVKTQFARLTGIYQGGALHQCVQRILTFFFITVAWVLFRADSLIIAVRYLMNMFTKWNLWVLTDGSLKNVGFYNGVEWVVIFCAIIIMLSVDCVLERTGKRIDQYLSLQGNFFRVIFILFMIITIAVFGNYGGYQANAFIYFQF